MKKPEVNWSLTTVSRSLIILASLVEPLSATCCSDLQDTLGDVVFVPQVPAYGASLQSYWAQQEQLITPSCIVIPKNAEQVSTTIQTINQFNAKARVPNGIPCQFAVKGGGHGHVSGVANIEDGVTIDMSSMSAVKVHRGNTITSVGAGARWGDVYHQLDAVGLGVAGGRVSGIGVGGLTTGGGVSFFSPRFGFVCDQVENFEVVLADGRIVDANAKKHRDLWFALKGGSSNFGIVTRFDLKTFTNRGVWGGLVFHPIQTLPQQISSFVALNNASKYDPHASVINSYVYSPQVNGWAVSNIIVYTKPQPFPPSLKPFTDIEPKISSSIGIRNLSNVTDEINQYSPSGFRQIYMTRTYGNDPNLLKEIFAIANATIQSILDIPGLVYEVVFQPIPPAITSKAAANGGDALGLDPADGPLVLTLQGVSWSNATDDEAVVSVVKAAFEQSDALAEKSGLLNRWIYLNYASKWEDPIASYGATNVEKLRAASKKYDPEGVFQNVMPGGFKLYPKNVTGGYVKRGE